MKLGSLIALASIATVAVAVAACGKPESKGPSPASAGAAPADASHETGQAPDAAPAPTPAPGPATATATARAPAKPPPALPPVTRWGLDPENSSVTFVCKHSMATNVRGMFRQPTGSVLLDDANPAHSKVIAAIDVNSITTGVEERDTDLKGPDFFDASTYPAINFVSTGFVKSSDSTYSVTGDLTMHGVTRPVTLAVTASPPFMHFGSIRRGIEATLEVQRQDFGVGVAVWNSPSDDNGELVVANDVAITIDAELVLQPEQGQAADGQGGAPGAGTADR